MKVLVCGDRELLNLSKPRLHIMFDRLKQLPSDTTIIHGAARGVDEAADAIARRLGFKVEKFPAQWGVFGDAAGPIRNRLMLDQEPDLVIAFHGDISKSKGTKDVIQAAEKRGIPVELNEFKREIKGEGAE